MAEYIDRDELLKKIRWADDPEDCIMSVKRMPAAEVAPVVQGEWLFGDIEPTGCAVRCSVCGWGVDHADPILWLEYAGHKYCGNCGAKMEDVDHENQRN